MVSIRYVVREVLPFLMSFARVDRPLFQLKFLSRGPQRRPKKGGRMVSPPSKQFSSTASGARGCVPCFLQDFAAICINLTSHISLGLIVKRVRPLWCATCISIPGYPEIQGSPACCVCPRWESYLHPSFTLLPQDIHAQRDVGGSTTCPRPRDVPRDSVDNEN